MSKTYCKSKEFHILHYSSHIQFTQTSNCMCESKLEAYLWVLLNLCIKRLPSANLIWILVVGTESSSRTTALSIDFSSSSGEEGVLTISGVRLWDKNERVGKQMQTQKTYNTCHWRQWHNHWDPSLTLQPAPPLASGLARTWLPLVSYTSSKLFHYVTVILDPMLLI